MTDSMAEKLARKALCNHLNEREKVKMQYPSGMLLNLLYSFFLLLIVVQSISALNVVKSPKSNSNRFQISKSRPP